MKKNFTRPRGPSILPTTPSNAEAINWIFIMRMSTLCTLFLVATINLVQAENGYGQTTEDTFIIVESRKASLKSVLSMLENKTEFLFVFPVEIIDRFQNVFLPAGSQSVKAILDKAFNGSGLFYKQLGKNIVIFENTTAAELPVSFQQVSLFVPIRGRITDSEGTPIPGVNVLVKGTTFGTSTDKDGNFYIEVPEDAEVFVFSFIGYKTLEAKIDGRTQFNITMQTDATTLASVEIIDARYYETTDRTKTGSIAKVSAKEIETQPVTSPLLAAQGRIAGLEIAPTSGVPGTSVASRIRGYNSFRTNVNSVVDGNLPLYVIDGVQIDPSPITSASTSIVQTGFDPLSTINPSNIESIQVLKDADATAIYGSRGANGVILIKTKNRMTKGKVNIDLNGYGGVGEVVSSLDMLDREQYLEMRREAINNDGGDAKTYYEHPDFGPLAFPDILLWDTTRYTDWQKELLGGTSNISDIQMNIGAGSETTSIGVGFGYHKETLIYPGSFGYQRYNGNVSLIHSSSDGRFSVNFTATFGSNRHKIFDSNILQGNALTLPPVAPPLYTADGSLNWQPNRFKYSTWSNPISWTRSTHNSESINLISNMNLSYRIVSGLYIKSSFGYSVLDQNEVLKYPISSLDPNTTAERFGRATKNDAKRASWIIEPQLSYQYKIGAHNLDFMLGTTFQESTSATEAFQGTGYQSDAVLGTLQGAGDIVSRQNNSQYRYVAAFSRLAYNYNEKYLFTLTGRRDGSSRFGPGRRYGNFGAIGIGWIFSNTDLLKNSPVLNFGKVRASYGSTGNDLISDNNYLPRYSPILGKYHGIVTVSPMSLFNPDYAWEVTKKMEVALEMGFFLDRLTLEAAWYRNRSSSQLVDYGLPLMTGFSSVKLNFPATIENTGFELTFGLRAIDNDNFRWNVSSNISFPRNKLVSFDQIEKSPYVSIYKIGEPIQIQRGYRSTGVNPTTGLYDFEDLDGDGTVTTADVEFTQSLSIDYYGGIANTLSYKGFEFSFLVQFSKRLDKIAPLGMPGAARNQPTSVLGRWKQEGDVADVQRFSSGYSQDASDAFTRWQQSDGVIKPISFARLKTVTVSYSFAPGALQKFGMKATRLFVQGQNLLTFTSFEGLDPETQNAAPPLRVLSAGVQIKI